MNGDPLEGLDAFTRSALESWRGLTVEQRDYAVGFLCGWAPDVVISASKRAIDVSRVDAELMRVEAQQ